MFTKQDMESLLEVYISPRPKIEKESDGRCHVCEEPCGVAFCSKLCVQRFDNALEQGYYDV
jgi:hypothetical protein